MARLAIATVVTALLVVPAIAQDQGGNSLGNVLQGIGRSLNGQANPPPNEGRTYYQRIYDETYNDSQQQFQNENDEQLRRDNRRVRDAWNRLRASSQALADEMSRRGIREY